MRKKKRRIINLTVQASRFAIFPLFIFSCSFLLFLYVYNVLPSSRSIYQTFSPSSILFHVHIHIFLYFTFYLLFFHHHRHHHLSSTQAVRRIKKMRNMAKLKVDLNKMNKNKKRRQEKNLRW